MLETNPDLDPIRIQGFNDQKIKKWQLKKNTFFLSKTAIYLSLGLHKVCPSYRRSLQLSKEAIQRFKTWTFTNFFLLLWVIFALLLRLRFLSRFSTLIFPFYKMLFMNRMKWCKKPGFHIWIRNPDLDPLARLNPDPIRIRIRNPVFFTPFHSIHE